MIPLCCDVLVAWQVAALVAACLWASVANAVPVKYVREPAVTSETASYGFDYVHLVQEWPGSFCDTKKG